MATTRQHLGNWGETLAQQFLEKRGYHLIEQNWRLGRTGELDLVAVDPDGTLVGVEIKTGRVNAAIHPVEQITPLKRHKLQHLLTVYISTRPQWQNANIRLDAIIIVKDGLTAKIRHIQNLPLD